MGEYGCHESGERRGWAVTEREGECVICVTGHLIDTMVAGQKKGCSHYFEHIEPIGG